VLRRRTACHRLLIGSDWPGRRQSDPVADLRGPIDPISPTATRESAGGGGGCGASPRTRDPESPATGRCLICKAFESLQSCCWSGRPADGRRAGVCRLPVSGAQGAPLVETVNVSGAEPGVVLGNDTPGRPIRAGQPGNEPPLSEPDCISVQTSIPVLGKRRADPGARSSHTSCRAICSPVRALAGTGVAGLTPAPITLSPCHGRCLMCICASSGPAGRSSPYRASTRRLPGNAMHAQVRA